VLIYIVNAKVAGSTPVLTIYFFFLHLLIYHYFLGEITNFHVEFESPDDSLKILSEKFSKALDLHSRILLTFDRLREAKPSTFYFAGEAIDGTHSSGAKYRLFGIFWLEELKDCRQELYFHKLEARLTSLNQGKFPIYHGSGLSHIYLVQSDSKQAAFDVSQEFARFQETESLPWSPPRREDELVPPSEDFNCLIAHHLHNPSFVTQHGETLDPTNPCIALIMANTFVDGKTLIFDHLPRREISDGLVDYPHVIRDPRKPPHIKVFCGEPNTDPCISDSFPLRE
jgi:hypothetical protein